MRSSQLPPATRLILVVAERLVHFQCSKLQVRVDRASGVESQNRLGERKQVERPDCHSGVEQSL